MDPESTDPFERSITLFFYYLAINVLLFSTLLIRMIVATKQFGMSQLFLYIGYIAVSILFVVFCFSVPKGSSWYMTEGFLERMKKEADIMSIRQWLETYKTNEQVELYEIPSADWIPELKRLNPKYIYMEQKDSIKIVRLVWGGGFSAYWGLVVGPENMEIPKSDSSDGGKLRILLEKGAYVWHDIR